MIIFIFHYIFDFITWRRLFLVRYIYYGFLFNTHVQYNQTLRHVKKRDAGFLVIMNFTSKWFSVCHTIKLVGQLVTRSRKKCYKRSPKTRSTNYFLRSFHKVLCYMTTRNRFYQIPPQWSPLLYLRLVHCQGVWVPIYTVCLIRC